MNARSQINTKHTRSSASRNSVASKALKELARPAVLGAIGVAALGALAVINRRNATAAEGRHPPIGQFLKVEGVRLHYIDRGTGPVLVLLHGNGAMIQDFLSSGLVDEAARTHRVIVFDRPGYGYSTRPRGTLWTPDAQADLLAAALRQLEVTRATIRGHSWAAAVAVAMAERHPDVAGSLVLEGGYFYPSARLDVVPMSLPASPVVGDVLRHTVSPLIARLAWPLMMRKIFGPAPTPDKFRQFPRDLALRPSHLRASAEETGLMVPCAALAQERYARLDMPVAIIAGAGDRMVTARNQSARLHREIPQSSFACLPDTGHMVHQTATAEVLSAVERVTTEAA